MSTLLIKTEFYKNDGSALVFVKLYLHENLVKTLYYEFYGSFLPVKSRVNDFALIAIMPYAMQHGYDVHVNGAVHFDVLRNMEESQDAWICWHPNLFNKIEISADEEIPSVLVDRKNAVMAFSGGLDATYTLHAHANKLLGRRSMNIVTGVLIHGFDIELKSQNIFEDALIKTRFILDSYGVSQSYVKTNWRELNTSWEETHMFGIASVMYQYSGVLDCGVIASDVAYDEEDLGWGSNAVTNSLFSLPSFPLYFTGGSHSRTQKAAVFSANSVVLDNIRVCYQDKLGNCGNCEKCIRTRLNFLSVGISAVPALGSIDPKVLLNSLRLDSPKEIERYNRILKRGSWHFFLKEKALLEKIVALASGKRPVLKFFKKLLNSVKKRSPF